MKCIHCKKKEVEENSLFVKLCNKCTGQNDLVMNAKKEVLDDLEKEFNDRDGNWDIYRRLKKLHKIK